MDSDELKALITKRLNDFYQQRAQWLDRVRLIDILGHENPHLIRAIGTYLAFDIVITALAAYLDSLDGGIFSDTFFEPVAQALTSRVISLDASAELPIQPLWKKLTGVPGFYLILIRLMETKTVSFKSYPAYQDAWARAANRFTLEFIGGFCDESGAIDWVKLVEFNSGNYDLDEFIA